MNPVKHWKHLAVFGTAAALLLTAVSAEAKVLNSNRKPFYVTLDGNGSRATIAKNGSLTIFAQCLVNQEEEDEIKIIATNSKGGWYDSEHGTFLRAGKRVVLFSEEEETGEPTYEGDEEGVSVATRNGRYLAIDGDTLGLGLNIFGHDCVAVGTVTSITGNP